MRSLDMDCLRTFLACASAPSFNEAGHKVNKSQSTVSMQMRRLEETVGQPLFAKHGRRNHLTSAGRELQDYAERMVRLNDEALSRFAPRSFQERIAIGTPDDYAESFLPAVFARFAAGHPCVEISIECRPSIELASMIDEGELDLAVVTMDERVNRAERIHTEPLTWAAPRDHRLELERPLPLAVWQPGCVWRKITLQALENADIPYRIAYTGWNATALMSTVHAGLAMAALPIRFMGGRLRPVPASAGLPELTAFDVGLMVGSKGRSEVIDAFAAEVRTTFDQLDRVDIAA